MFCDNPEGWDGGRVAGRSKAEGIYIYIYISPDSLNCTEKLTQHCKAIILL